LTAVGWSEVDTVHFQEAVKSTPNDFISIKFAPHDWLFPKCTYIVHHGGAGTVGASLLAGKPMVICSVLGDQPFWGKKMTEMKLGWHVGMKELTTAKVKKKLRKN
jgi:sterol 3beta-glucosyltransferase